MSQFIVQGGVALRGSVKVGGSKNATLPILAATLLTEEVSVLHNVPDISDVHAFLRILSHLGAEVSFDQGTVTVNPKNVRAEAIPHDLVKHMRASILLLGPLLGRFGEVELGFPGGCVLGKRSVQAHLHALQSLGAEVVDSQDAIHLKSQGLTGRSFILSEASVTATENAVMAAVMAKGVTEIRWAAMEPHVQDLCHFLKQMGAQIEGIGTPTLTIQGGRTLRGTDYKVTADYLEAGTFALAGVLTRGEITIEDCPTDHLDSFWQKLEEVGAKFSLEKNRAHIHPHEGLRAVEKLQTSVYPGFATDLQAPFTVLLTQCEGVSPVHETLFEGRLNYLPELERMGAQTQLLNPHQAVIRGATPLRGAPIVSHDIRAGAAMVLAALIARGETVISDVIYTDRGYERFDQKLRELGAKIERRG
jgi:UDP-N-acetylglucosamine 1-carboxyvinyltransferase